MIDTSRIASGFDVEVLLGGGWFRVALQALADSGQLAPGGLPPPLPPDADIKVTDVAVVFSPPGRDLAIDLTINGLPFSLLATLELSEDGTELRATTNIEGVEVTIPFDALDDLAGPPVLTKVRGGDGTDPAMALLANLDLRANPQDEEPLPPGEHVPRGDAALARSFLPEGKDMAVGVGQATFPRFANDVWHTQLRADDGSHPFPDAENALGTWRSARILPRSNRIRVRLKADVPVDWWPDAEVTITIDLRPTVAEGRLTFEMEVDTDVDTGLLGDLFAALGGGLIGFLIGLVAGGALIGAGIGAFVGVIVLEVGEYVVGGVIRRRVVASLEGEPPLPPLRACRNGIVVEATPVADEGGLVLGPTQAIPHSIPLATDRPDPLHERTTVVTTAFDEVRMDGSGLGVAGTAWAEERFQPLEATLVGATRGDPSADGAPGELRGLTYRAEDGTLVDLEFSEVLERAAEGELKAPFRVRPLPGEADIRVPEGRLPTVCLDPTNIRRRETIITEVLFSSGAHLAVSETVQLQDASALVVRGLQLIHPRDGNPYYRAFADGSTENNFESLPGF